MPKLRSIFNTLDDLEANVVVKNIEKEAKKFYSDESKDLDERFKVFVKYGPIQDYIYRPKTKLLKVIYDWKIESECDYGSLRGHTIKCDDILEQWIEALAYERCVLDYSENKYHPELKQTKRNYEPSEAAIKRLEDYYKRLFIKDGVAGFVYDW